jgi:peptidoglycan hydrolase-like protein with peptidoglycan-binding domain
MDAWSLATLGLAASFWSDHHQAASRTYSPVRRRAEGGSQMSAAQPDEVQVTVGLPLLPRQLPPPDPVVERLQHMLNATGLYGLDPLVEDGDWGPKTREAVEWFQKDRALPVNGKVNKATWAELLHYWLRQDMFG